MISTRSAGALVFCMFTASLGAQATIVNNVLPVIGFVDLSTTGGIQIAGIADDSEHNIVTTIGNGMFPAGNVRIGNNGVAVAGVTSGEISFANAVIPGFVLFNQSFVPVGLPAATVSAIVAYWDDLLPGPGTSIWWQESGGVLYIMWKGEHHFSAPTALGITFEIQVFSSPAFGTPWIQVLYPDVLFDLAPCCVGGGLSATIGFVEGDNSPAIGKNSQWSFDTNSIGSGQTLSMSPNLRLIPDTPNGPGSIRLSVIDAPPGGTYFVALTTVQGNYPNGWLFGLDISYAELGAEIAFGFPFGGPLQGFGAGAVSGTAVIGPFSGLPSGLTVYAIALASFPGAIGPATRSQAIAYTIP